MNRTCPGPSHRTPAWSSVGVAASDPRQTGWCAWAIILRLRCVYGARISCISKPAPRRTSCDRRSPAGCATDCVGSGAWSWTVNGINGQSSVGRCVGSAGICPNSRSLTGASARHPSIYRRAHASQTVPATRTTHTVLSKTAGSSGIFGNGAGRPEDWPTSFMERRRTTVFRPGRRNPRGGIRARRNPT